MFSSLWNKVAGAFPFYNRGDRTGIIGKVIKLFFVRTPSLVVSSYLFIYIFFFSVCVCGLLLRLRQTDTSQKTKTKMIH